MATQSATQSVTVRLPDSLYQQLKQRAEHTQRTVEDELLEVVAAAAPVADDLPADLVAAISPLASLDDDALWRAARARLPSEASERLEDLNVKRQREGLTHPEAEEASTLLHGYERAMLVRAQATALLQERGHDVSILLTAA